MALGKTIESQEAQGTLEGSRVLLGTSPRCTFNDFAIDAPWASSATKPMVHGDVTIAAIPKESTRRKCAQ